MTGSAGVALGVVGGPRVRPAPAADGHRAGFFLLSKLGRDHIDVLPFLFGVVLVAALSVTVLVAVVGEPVGTAGARDLGLAAATGLGPGILGYFVMTWPLWWVAANVPPVLRLAQPVASGILAWWLLAEPITGVHALRACSRWQGSPGRS